MPAKFTVQKLIDLALEARSNAYAPYSKFKVGAALLTEAGPIYKGCNVENASFGLTICAERNVLGNALVDGSKNFSALCIATSGGVSPCGACRQFIIEFEPDLLIIQYDVESGKITGESKISQLLPNSFSF